MVNTFRYDSEYFLYMAESEYNTGLALYDIGQNVSSVNEAAVQALNEAFVDSVKKFFKKILDGLSTIINKFTAFFEKQEAVIDEVIESIDTNASAEAPAEDKAKPEETNAKPEESKAADKGASVITVNKYKNYNFEKIADGGPIFDNVPTIDAIKEYENTNDALKDLVSGYNPDTPLQDQLLRKFFSNGDTLDTKEFTEDEILKIKDVIKTVKKMPSKAKQLHNRISAELEKVVGDLDLAPVNNAAATTESVNMQIRLANLRREYGYMTEADEDTKDNSITVNKPNAANGGNDIDEAKQKKLTSYKYYLSAKIKMISAYMSITAEAIKFAANITRAYASTKRKKTTKNK